MIKLEIETRGKKPAPAIGNSKAPVILMALAREYLTEGRKIQVISATEVRLVNVP